MVLKTSSTKTDFSASSPRITITNPTHVHGLAVGYLATCAVTSVLACADFLLFETGGTGLRPGFFALMKPAVFSLSPVLVHLLTFLFAGSMVFSICLAAQRVMGRWALVTVPGLPTRVAMASIALGLVALRAWRTPQQPSLIVILAAAAAFALAAVALAVRRPTGEPAGGPRSLRWLLAVVSLPIIVAFVGPEVHELHNHYLANHRRTDHGRPNIILVVLDTVRGDRLTLDDQREFPTPVLDQFARESLFFQNAFSTAPWTVPSHASMFTGLPTRDHGADWGHTALEEGFYTLAEFLRDEGYQTCGLSENPFLGPSTGFAQGFDDFAETWREPLPTRMVMRLLGRLGIAPISHQHAPRTVGLCTRWLGRAAAEGKPFFAFMNLMAAHLPRYPIGDPGSDRMNPEALARIEPVNLVPERYYLPEFRLDATDLELMSNIYDQQISYLDSHIARILDRLSSMGIADNTIVVITSDHGECFGEHGLIEHQFGLYNSLIHVPLMIRYPKKLAPRVVTAEVSTAALFPTLVDLLDCRSASLPSHISCDRSLGGVITASPVFSEFGNGVEMLRGVLGPEAPNFDYSPFDHELESVIFGTHKYIRSSSGHESLFDLAEDWAEERDRAQDNSELLQAMRTLLASFRGHDRADAVPRPPPALDPAVESALRELGYVR